MKLIGIAGIAFALVAGVSLGQTRSTQPPDFLFSEDNQAKPSAGESDKPTSKTLLRADNWLNQPLTRLDYIMLNMETTLSESLTPLVKEYAPNYFEPDQYRHPPQAKFRVRYFQELGRLFVSASVRDLGKPKKPMKDFCLLVADSMRLSFPFEQLGYVWHNTTLGVLAREGFDSPTFREPLRVLMESQVHMVDLTSTYKVGDRTDLFIYTCRKQGKDEDFEYFKYSGSLRN